MQNYIWQVLLNEPFTIIVTWQHVHMLVAIHVIGQVTTELTKMLHLGPKLHLHLPTRG